MWGGGWCWRSVGRVVAACWVWSILGVGEPLGVAVGGFAQGVVRAGNVCVEPLSVGLAWGHVVDVWAVVGVVKLVGSARLSTAACAISFVLEATDGGAEVGNVGCVGEGGGRLEVGEYAGSSLVGFFCISLYVMVGCVGAE